MAFTGLQYNPHNDGIHSVDSATSKAQLQSFYWLKKSLITARKEQFFSQLASTTGMPKHFGKTIKVLEYVPLLDERNINDQGIDAAGVTMINGYWTIKFPTKTLNIANAAAAGAKTALENNTNGVTADISAGADSAGSGYTTVILSDTSVIVDDATKKNTILALALRQGTLPVVMTAVEHSGNLYGSSKDIGTIIGKLPTLTENGGRVNRVGFTRLQREGSLHRFGFFYEFNKESLDFDSDEELNDHLSTELMNGAVQLTEAILQKDLLMTTGAVVMFAGDASKNSEVNADTLGAECLVDYRDLMRLSQALTDNRTPKQTKVITGSRLVDTRTIPAGRVMFIGSELVPVVKAMKDLHQERAFIPVHMYADAGTVLNGEIGTVDEFRIVQVPEMQHWNEGKPLTGGDDHGYRAENGRYNVYPMLVIGDDSFTTIGFQTDGKSAKFSVITKMPGSETADRNDPYGETGFSSIKWYYGILVKRPERIGMIRTVAPV